MMMAQACAFNAVPICTLYHTLPVENVGQSLTECAARAIFTNAELLPNIERVIAKTPITLIVYDGEADRATLNSFKWCKNLDIIHINELRRIGQDHAYQGQRAKRDDVYCCMYTSGGGELQPALTMLTPQVENPRECF
jgi:long-chain acyl-CoA synthetase